MRLVAKIIGSIVALLVVLVLALGLALWFGGGPLMKWALEHPVSRLAGRRIAIGGPLTVAWGGVTRIVVNDLAIANASWGSAPDIFTAHRLEIDFRPLSFLKAPLQIPLVKLDQSGLLLETSKTGQHNWDFLGKLMVPGKRGSFPELNRFTIAGGQLIVHNQDTGAEVELGIDTLRLDAPTLTSPVKVAAKGSYQKQPLTLAGSIGPLAQLRTTTQPYVVDVAGRLQETDFKIGGSAAHPLAFAGLHVKIALNGRKFHHFAALFGLTLPPLPDFRGTTLLLGGNGKYELSQIALTLGQSDLAGTLGIDTNGRLPDLKAVLTSKLLDLANFKGLYGATPVGTTRAVKRTPVGKIVPDTQIEIRKLPGFNAELNFTATRVVATDGLPIERVTLVMSLKNGVLMLKPLKFVVAAGDVALDVTYTALPPKGPPRLQGAIDIRHVDLHKLLNNPTKPLIVRETAGILGGGFKLDSTGTSPAELLGHMNGTVDVFLDNGQISDLLQELAKLDALEALGLYVTGDKPVPIHCFVARFNVASGLARVQTLLLETGSTQIGGTGDINFANETLDLTLTPRNRQATLATLHTPVTIGGTFAQPSFAIAKTALVERAGAALGLGLLFPPAALLPFVSTGLGTGNACSTLYAQGTTTAAGPSPAATPAVPPAQNALLPRVIQGLKNLLPH